MKSLQLLIVLPARQDASLEIIRQASPSLFKLLNRGKQKTHEPSLAGTLCQAFGIKQQQDWPLAPISAFADQLESAAGYWFRLDPVHLEVVMGGLILHPPESLQLSLSEARALIADINLHWQREGWKIQAINPTRWHLRLPEAPNLRTTPLDRMDGEYLTPHLPRGADARLYLKRINEVQMLMHSHPVNLAREDAGRPVINGLWLWGGGNLPACKTKFDLCVGDNAEFQALAYAANCPFIAPPNALSQLNPCNRALVALTQPASDWDGNFESHLAQLERDWFAPLLHQLIWGRIRYARLDLIGYQAVSLTPARSWRLWR